MKVDILASGSGGNCIALRFGQTTILVDAGVPKTKIEKRLLDVGIRPDEIAAIFVTHAHKDHVQGLPLANKYRIPVYAAENEWKDIKGVDEELRNVLHADEACIWYHDCGHKYTHVEYFRTHHDAYDSVGYTVIGEKKVSICLDTGHVDDEMIEAMADSDIYIIEANHEPDMVMFSNYPDSVKARILSDIGHLSNEQTAAALKHLVRGLGERIYLTHLSGNNNMPALARMTVETALRQRGLIANEHYFLEVV